MQADLPWQTSTHKCQIDYLKQNAETTELPDLITKSICWNKIPKQLNCLISSPKWIAKLNCQTELPNRIAKQICQPEWLTWITKLNHQSEQKLPDQIWFDKTKLPNCFDRLDLAYWIIEFAFDSAWMNLSLSLHLFPVQFNLYIQLLPCFTSLNCFVVSI
jgi:hypothetical protein